MQLCFSWSNLLKISSTKASNFLIWSVPWLTFQFHKLRVTFKYFFFFHSKVLGRKVRGCNFFLVSKLSPEVFEPLMSRVTLDEVFQILNWSFECMSSGASPSCDWKGRHFHVDSPAGKKAGSALAGGYIAPMVALQGDTFPHIPKCQGGMLLLVIAVYAELEDQELLFAKCLGLLLHGGKLFGQPAPGKLGVTGHRPNCLTFHGSVLARYVWITYIVSTLALTNISLPAFCTSCASTSSTMNQPPTWLSFGTGSKHFMLRQTHLTDIDIWTSCPCSSEPKGLANYVAKESDIKGFGEILLLVWNEFKNDAVETHRMITAMLKLNVEMENSWPKTNVMTLSHQCLPKDFMTVLIKYHTCNACYMIALLMNLDLLCLGLLNLSI